MIKRAVSPIIFSEEWGRQMRFITGPRQCGKTTIAKEQLQTEGCSELYFLWDLREIRQKYRNNELFFEEGISAQTSKKPWICFDEIHKYPRWKNVLKGIFDTTGDKYQFIVTGSAKLEIFKRAGDSLSGRYFTFHLFPLTLHEFFCSDDFQVESAVPKSSLHWIETRIQSDEKNEHFLAMKRLLQYGGFPEPFLKQSTAFHAKWAQDYADTVIREDIGQLTRILDREYLHNLYHLLPEMVGSHISESSIASHIEVSHPTVKTYLNRLEDFYLMFKVHPYSKNIKRALLKAPKCYLYDWTRVEDPGKRFENYVALELYSRLHLWMDASGEKFSLFYIKDKSGNETDFLILRNQKPWLLVETKVSDQNVEAHHYRTQQALGGIPLIQLCQKDGVCKKEQKDVYRISASRFLS